MAVYRKDNSLMPVLKQLCLHSPYIETQCRKESHARKTGWILTLCQHFGFLVQLIKVRSNQFQQGLDLLQFLE